MRLFRCFSRVATTTEPAWSRDEDLESDTTSVVRSELMARLALFDAAEEADNQKSMLRNVDGKELSASEAAFVKGYVKGSGDAVVRKSDDDRLKSAATDVIRESLDLDNESTVADPSRIQRSVALSYLKGHCATLTPVKCQVCDRSVSMGVKCCGRYAMPVLEKKD
jgi:hypothetical protein